MSGTQSLKSPIGYFFITILQPEWLADVIAQCVQRIALLFTGVWERTKALWQRFDDEVNCKVELGQCGDPHWL